MKVIWHTLFIFLAYPELMFDTEKIGPGKAAQCVCGPHAVPAGYDVIYSGGARKECADTWQQRREWKLATLNEVLSSV